MGNRGKAVALEKEYIIKWLESGGTFTSLAKEIGVALASITHHAKKLGIKAKKGRPKGIPMSISQRENMRNRNQGKNNPFYNKKHSEETREKMAKNHADFTGDKNPFKKALENNPEKRVLASNRMKDWWKSLSEDRRKEVLSNSSNAQSKNEKNFPMPNSKSGHFIGKKCGKIFYRSSWELAFAEFLEKSNKVGVFSLEAMCLKYEDKNGIIKTTRVDFIIELKNKIKIMVEVKPIGLLLFNNNPYKIKAQQKYCEENNWKHFILSSDKLEDMKEIVKS